MFSDLVLLQQLWQDARPLLSGCLAEERLTKLDNELTARAENCRPVVMVYGVYNAGKSTFINALAGKVVAEMNDIPVTDRVTRYPFDRFEIIDTPGIDAPVEHELVTREQLSLSDAVIFMLSSDGVFDEQATYAEIFRILEASKPLLLVINNKSGYSEADVEYTAIVDKIKHNLCRLASPDLAEIALQVPVWLINAKSALKGKLEQKSVLLARSNIQALEREVQRLFMATDKAAMLKTLKSLVRNEIDSAIFKLEDLQPEGEAKSLSKLLARVTESRQTLQAKTERNIRSAKVRMKDNVFQLLSEQQYEQVKTSLAEWQDHNAEYFQHELGVALAEIGQQAEKLISAIPRFSGGGLGGAATFSSEGPSFFNLADLVQLGRKLKLDEGALKEGMIGAMKLGKDYFPALFKGIGPKTMEKYAARVVPFIGPAMDLAMGVYDYYQAKAAEEKQEEARRLYLQRISEQASQLVTEVEEALQEAFTDTVRQIFTPIVQQLQDELDALEGSSAQNGRLAKRLMVIREA
ncbi:GTPase [Erwinia sp. CGal63]|uniref:GTPase n=1 Tax=Erwinia sp. CGal63 TaxID=2919889 RepID=UPI0030087FE1